ncbi:MAG TPA: DNA-directed RNA polymerase subunit omega [Syntrophales bacterium]|jgi:DNA-directed RNA polymerase subunit omega|nr:DNA-directed RNA polymerase subunit omega [Syntrophales bacterium]HON23372.1 DNA-directed RNA polymerase subunit omega [Syntrophales bacterium]HOU77294.1 DNA-directed RNA polymerase subunit omega [Syntrophales bacterium]HPC32724.1 DNA-directed RNA polymerase subunit omega [Syntrophales bacterium]HQG35367.1 DNA-directed RNA polymerase subunit omega [Syntrophales bacterium]
MARITVEDSLREAKNRFALVLLTSQRAIQLLKGAQPLGEVRNNREIVTALREIAAGKVTYAHPEKLKHTQDNFRPILDHTEFIEDDEYTE